MTYEWKTGYYKTSADVAGSVCKELENTVGLTAKNLVDASRPEDAPLHKEFEWRDDIAAEKFREQQARVLISNLVVITEETAPVRAYISINSAGQSYESIEVVLKDEDKRMQMFARALGELDCFKRKYANLKEFSGVFAEIEKLHKVSFKEFEKQVEEAANA